MTTMTTKSLADVEKAVIAANAELRAAYALIVSAMPAVSRQPSITLDWAIAQRESSARFAKQVPAELIASAIAALEADPSVCQFKSDAAAAAAEEKIADMVSNKARATSCSLDAGERGNEDAAWGSSSSDGWIVD